MVGLPAGGKNFEDIYNRLDTIPACDRQTDGQTSCHGKVRDMHMRRAVKMAAFQCTGRSRGDVRTYAPFWTIRDPPLQREASDLMSLTFYLISLFASNIFVSNDLVRTAVGQRGVCAGKSVSTPFPCKME